MVRWVKDRTGRFAERPHYEPKELDRECENIVSSFLRNLHGGVEFPIVTDDLTKLIEEHADSLDQWADLSVYGDDVEGVTAFHHDRAATVYISEKLSNDERRENRLRTTLTHEFGHVHFHRHLWDAKFGEGRLFARDPNADKAICKRDTIVNSSTYDWMEWQAGYVCGAILMPATHLRRVVDDYCSFRGLHGAVFAASDHGRELIGATMRTFAVSEDAARVRLVKLGILSETDRQPPLFS